MVKWGQFGLATVSGLLMGLSLLGSNAFARTLDARQKEVGTIVRTQQLVHGCGRDHRCAYHHAPRPHWRNNYNGWQGGQYGGQDGWQGGDNGGQYGGQDGWQGGQYGGQDGGQDGWQQGGQYGGQDGWQGGGDSWQGGQDGGQGGW
jgi:hypothetical protein